MVLLAHWVFPLWLTNPDNGSFPHRLAWAPSANLVRVAVDRVRLQNVAVRMAAHAIFAGHVARHRRRRLLIRQFAEVCDQRHALQGFQCALECRFQPAPVKIAESLDVGLRLQFVQLSAVVPPEQC